jgi:hypothetical protein
MHLGLMAKHIAEGRDFPIFFYVPALWPCHRRSAAGSSELPGSCVGAVPLKLAMLVLWLVGISFYFLTFSRTLGRARSFWITLAVVLMPAWAVSSMKAWSGYLTAFALAGLSSTPSRARRANPFATGVPES